MTIRTWGDVYHKWVRKGVDHGYAAHLADQYEKRRKAATMTQKERLLRKAMRLEDKWRETREEKDWKRYLERIKGWI